ncbi:MAG: ATP-GRASP peptide maturase of grasp-with-spasm system [Crocinitomix sp.]|jgi:ATP-GRASP peptide maturase of grasp-with-spasm system
MIYLISTPGALSAYEIQEWLRFYDCEYIRINKGDQIDDLKITVTTEVNSIEFTHLGKEVCIRENDNSRFMYRKGMLTNPDIIEGTGNEISEFNKNTRWNWENIRDFILNRFYNFKSLGSYHHELNNNKIENLRWAAMSGFNIPHGVICTSRKEVISMFNTYGEIITKDLRYPINIKLDKEGYATAGTTMITEADLEGMPEKFSPSLVQQYIEKEFEIRIFFMNQELFPMAIFSQSDDQTKVDYRNYNWRKMNRNVPYKLDTETESNVLSFIEKSGLDTGSIDLIRTKTGAFYFLEVNPSGQFSWLSYYCNYEIEKRIANYLKDEEK